MAASIVQRPCTTADTEFVFDVTRTTMRHHVIATWGTWDDAEQKVRAAQSLDLATHRVIVADGRDAGIVAVSMHADHLRLDKLFVLPPFQRQGIGTAIVQALQRQARVQRLPLRLRVLRVNPAALWYERLGFRRVGETAERLFYQYAG